MLSNKKNGTLYVGVTSNLLQRVYQHRQRLVDGFSKRYGLDRLVYFEAHQNMEMAITYEKKLKNRPRAFKIALIEKANRDWNDLYEQLV